MNNSLMPKTFFPQCLFFFKNYSLVKVIYLKTSSSCETQITLIEMVYLNKTHTYTHTKDSENDNTGKG